MATPKEAPQAQEPRPVYNMGLGAEDVQLPRLRIIGKLAKLADADLHPHPSIEGRALAVPGDIAIGADAEDDESTIIGRPGPVKVYVIQVTSNYGTKFGGTEGGPWEEGDPDMPSDAQRQFNYLLYVPSESDTFPVKYTASSTAAREARGMNTKLVAAGLNGTPPYEFAWELTTKTNTSGTNSWPGPVFKLAQPDPAEVAKAKAMHDSIVGAPSAQLGSGEDDPQF